MGLTVILTLALLMFSNIAFGMESPHDWDLKGYEDGIFFFFCFFIILFFSVIVILGILILIGLIVMKPNRHN
jgi:heme/copper-type cytochrome/quinol oxidase subunit 2